MSVDDVRSDEGVRLGDLVRELGDGARLEGDADVRVFGVHHDSRRVRPGDLFVVRRGRTHDGASFATAARAGGAAAILCAEGTPLAAQGLPVLWVKDAVSGLAIAASAVYGHPSFGLDVIGVTGTNGKTTTTHLVRAAVDGALSRTACGLVGTVGYRYGDLAWEASHTTPEADELARAMSGMRSAGATHVAMEVSSIALELGRVRAVRFAVGAFTNLTQDHLDFHGTMDAYAAAKRRLFEEHGPMSAVVCVDGEFGRTLAGSVRAPVLRVSARPGASEKEADLAPVHARMDARGIDAELRTPEGPLALRSPLVGAHNLENLVVALGVAHALSLDLGRAAGALARENGAPGRLERCDAEGDDVTVLVDYAHTPDALARVISALRAVTDRRIVCVFGCGGDRDAGKRAPMGRAVAELADVAVVTSDNPRTEDPALIAAAVERGVKDGGLAPMGVSSLGTGRGYVVELDRRAAIDLAVLGAAPGDVVLLAGKGHEDYQIVGTEKRAFDDRVEARRALAARRGARS
jgi:UDP-N-acetylmuramoyl-L-alanyl-D-glutamate--2,6-diaminopimelate ligase